MKNIYSIGVAGIATFALLQSAYAYPRGGSHSFGSTPHFSAPSYRSAPSYHAAPSYRSASNYRSAPSRSFSNRPQYSAAPRFQNRTYVQRTPRVSSAALQNTAYLNRTRFAGDRTATFNSRNVSRSTARLTPANRSLAARAQGFERSRIVARHPASWQRNWDRSRDHTWRGHRCHFRNGFWFVYDPFPFYGYGYPYGYGYGVDPYSSYYDSGYYDDGSYATDESAPAVEQPQQEYQTDSQVNDVQSALAREGYYDGAIDGKWGPRTQKALRRFQRDHGLDATGSINRAVIEALRLQ
jgi:murein L,D-transpeptidase YcbB/YkuD